MFHTFSYKFKVQRIPTEFEQPVSYYKITLGYTHRLSGLRVVKFLISPARERKSTFKLEKLLMLLTPVVRSVVGNEVHVSSATSMQMHTILPNC